MVISAGFAELGADGARLQNRLLAAARRHGMRIVGPNCLGVAATASGLNATFTSQELLPGGIAIASQSAGAGIAITAEAQRRGAGISSFVSTGNKSDVSGNDLLRLWADDAERPTSCSSTSSRSATPSASPAWPAPCHGASR